MQASTWAGKRRLYSTSSSNAKPRDQTTSPFCTKKPPQPWKLRSQAFFRKSAQIVRPAGFLIMRHIGVHRQVGHACATMERNGLTDTVKYATFLALIRTFGH